MTDYAVVEHGGKQYRVSPGDVLLVERTVPDLKAGDELRFKRTKGHRQDYYRVRVESIEA